MTATTSDPYADLIAQARAGALPMPAEPFQVNNFMHISNPNKAVLFAQAQKDAALLASLAAWWKQTQAGEQETGLSLF